MKFRLLTIIGLAVTLTGCSHMSKLKLPKIPPLKMPKISLKDTHLDGITDTVNPVPAIRRWKALNSYQWMDKNDDGLMDYAEFHAAADADPNFWVKASEANAHIPDFIASEFKLADVNNDARISPEEFLAAGGGVKALR